MLYKRLYIKKTYKDSGGVGGGGVQVWYPSNVATACLQQGREYHNVYGPISSLLSGSWAFCSSYELGGGVSPRPSSPCSPSVRYLFVIIISQNF